MPSRIDTAGHTKAVDYPVAEYWGESRNVQFRGWDSNPCESIIGHVVKGPCDMCMPNIKSLPLILSEICPR